VEAIDLERGVRTLADAVDRDLDLSHAPPI
jgi:hypothetical protein